MRQLIVQHIVECRIIFIRERFAHLQFIIRTDILVWLDGVIVVNSLLHDLMNSNLRFSADL